MSRSQKLTGKQQQWLEHIKQADAYQGSLVKYARDHNLNHQLLYQWKSKLIKLGIYTHRKPTKPTGFITVQPTRQKTTGLSCTVSFDNGTSVQLIGELDTPVIRAILTEARV